MGSWAASKSCGALGAHPQVLEPVCSVMLHVVDLEESMRWYTSEGAEWRRCS